jgi:hypothetical protein
MYSPSMGIGIFYGLEYEVPMRKLNKYVQVRVLRLGAALGKVDESLLDVYVDVFVR